MSLSTETIKHGKNFCGIFRKTSARYCLATIAQETFIVKGGDDYLDENENRYVKTLLVRKRASQLSASDPSTIYRFPSTYLDRAVQSKLQTV